MGGETEPLAFILSPLDDWREKWAIRRNKNRQGKQGDWEITSFSDSFANHKSHMNWPEIEPGPPLMLEAGDWPPEVMHLPKLLA
jgi:hypothetical protein